MQQSFTYYLKKGERERETEGGERETAMKRENNPFKAGAFIQRPFQ